MEHKAYSEANITVLCTLFDHAVTLYVEPLLNLTKEVALLPVTRYPYSRTPSEIVYHLGRALSSHFRDIFRNMLKLPSSDSDYVQFAVSKCYAFLDYTFKDMTEEIGERNMVYFRLLMACAFLTEHSFYCMEFEKCYRFVHFLPLVMIVVCDRWMDDSLHASGGWEGLVEYTEFTHNLQERDSDMILGLSKDSDAVKDMVRSIKHCAVLETPVSLELKEIRLFHEVIPLIPKVPGYICCLCFRSCWNEFLSLNIAATFKKELIAMSHIYTNPVVRPVAHKNRKAKKQSNNQ